MRKVVVAALVLAAAGWVGWSLTHRAPRTEVATVMSRAGAPAKSTVLLDADGAAKQVIRVYEPLDGAAVALQDLTNQTFRWAAVPGANMYLFIANNEVGHLIWRANAPDTTLTLPAKVTGALVAGERLKWLVQVPQLSASTDLNRVELK